MKHEIRVSRHGFTECPSCLAHIRLDEEWARTTCPFCKASLLGAVREGPRDLMTVLRTVHQRTGGALAASLLTFGLATACEETGLDLQAPPRDGGPAVAQAQDAGIEDGGFVIPDSGVVRDAGVVDAGDMVPSPEYGLPPMDAGVTDAQVIDAGDTPVTPLYGKAPPLDGGTFDASTVVDAGETPVTPHYGLPPALDGGIVPLDAGTEEDGGS
ncbi:MAG: hypothetical protein RIT81_24500 [Deltaproteobacteria bacterium]